MGNHWSEFMGNHESTVLPFNEDRVLTLSQFASNAGISLVILRRSIARDEGPIVTKLSTRRLGIRVRHAREWLDARASGILKEGKTEDQKIRACLLGPVGTAMGANCLNREGKNRVHA